MKVTKLIASTFFIFGVLSSKKISGIEKNLFLSKSQVSQSGLKSSQSVKRIVRTREDLFKFKFRHSLVTCGMNKFLNECSFKLVKSSSSESFDLLEESPLKQV